LIEDGPAEVFLFEAAFGTGGEDLLERLAFGLEERITDQLFEAAEFIPAQTGCTAGGSVVHMQALEGAPAVGAQIAQDTETIGIGVAKMMKFHGFGEPGQQVEGGGAAE
jgi:hypothetical protein